MQNDVPIMTELLEHARSFAPRAHVPYSREEHAAVALLADGRWVPGVRVESASFSLSIPSVLNAVTTAVAMGRRDVVAIASTETGSWEDAFIRGLPSGPWRKVEGGWVLGTDPLPSPIGALDVFIDPPGAVVSKGIREAAEAARQAWTSESDFPVGAVLVASDGRAIPGCNVEHVDWPSILCAERNALSTAITQGVRDYHVLFLSCVKDPAGTPCGACRQLLVEHAPDLAIWMDRGSADPERVAAADLLPHAFSSDHLSR